MNVLLSPTTTNIQDPVDFQANQRGEITPAQNTRLNFSVGFQSGCVGLAFAVFFVPFFFILGLTLSNAFPVWVGLLVMIGVIGVLALAGGSSLWKIWGRWSALKRDRENRAIRQGQGQLAYERGKYVLQASGRIFDLPNSRNACSLKPGVTYRFYFLEECGFVLSAEELFPASPSQARNSLLEILASANNFSVEELELNRNGEIGSAQRMKVLPNLIIGIVFGAVPVVLGFLFFSTFSSQRDDFMAVLIPGLFLAIFGLVGGFMFFNAVADLMAASPMVMEGVGHKEKRTSGGRNRSTRYYYVIEGVAFQVGRGAFSALVDGEKYRIYALPRTKRMLTIEPL